jgi:hypothetical protein
MQFKVGEKIVKCLVWILPRVGFTCLPDAGVCFSVKVKAKGIYLVQKGYISQNTIDSREPVSRKFVPKIFRENPFQDNLL